jgi:DNA-binding MarR family transcriptional regulator
MPVEPLETPCVCTSLRMTTRAVTRLYDRALAGTGLRATGYAILARLEAEGPLSLGSLAARLALERTSCSREVGLLAESGLVRVSVGGDRRQRLLALTPAGKRRLARARPRWRRVQADVADVYGTAETRRLLAALRALLAAGRELGALDEVAA